MSEEQELTYEQKAAATRSALLNTLIFLSIGWIGFWIWTWFNGTNQGGVAVTFLIFIPMIIASWPMLKRMLRGGFGAMLATPDNTRYYNVYRDGRKERDYGTESQMGILKVLIKLFMLFCAIVLGIVLTIIYLVILLIKYAYFRSKLSPKPSFISGPIPIMIAGLAVIIVAPLVYVAVDKAQMAAYRAERGIVANSDYDYDKNESGDGVILKKYTNKKGGDIVIPSEIGGLPVVQLDSRGFSELNDPPFYGTKRRERITSVVIPDTVTSIIGSFSECKSLTQITLPKNLKSITGGAFSESGLTSIVIPEGVTEIGVGVFSKCAALVSVTLPRSLERMYEGVFENCTSLVDVRIPSGARIQYGKNAWDGTKREYFFQEGQTTGSFKGCTGLSEASRQAIMDSSYTGEF